MCEESLLNATGSDAMQTSSEFSYICLKLYTNTKMPWAVFNNSMADSYILYCVK